MDLSHADEITLTLIADVDDDTRLRIANLLTLEGEDGATIPTIDRLTTDDDEL